MADALCGPSNALHSFQKHTSVDRTLQQDRLATHESASHGFRSSSRLDGGLLDAEYEAFQSGHMLENEPLAAEPSSFQKAANSFHPELAQTGAPNWASEFQRLHIVKPQAQPSPGFQLPVQEHLQRELLGGWHNEFSHQENSSTPNAQQQTTALSREFRIPQWEPRASILPHDHAAFEQAFDVLSKELSHSEEHAQEQEIEHGQEASLVDNLPWESVQSLELKGAPLTERIGSDRILDEIPEDEEKQQARNVADELARTAGELLNNVKHDQSQKFRESSFLSLMRQLRDREVQVEGDKIVDSESSNTNKELFEIVTIPEDLLRWSLEREMYRSFPLRQHPHTRARAPLELAYALGPSDGSSVSDKVPFRATVISCDAEPPYTELPHLQGSSSALPSQSPPSFSSLFLPSPNSPDQDKAAGVEPHSPAEAAEAAYISGTSVEAETKAALPSDAKEGSSNKGVEDREPPPPYTEVSSPLDSFTYLMAAAGGAASIITQVQQVGVPPVNTLADVGADEHITLDLRGTRFVLSRDELLTLPEFVLLSLFPNGLLPDGHMNSFHEGDIYPVDYDPASLQYMLDFFRNVAQTIPSSSPSPVASSTETATSSTEAVPGSARDMLQDRAGIIVLREDLDFYAIPPKAEIDQPEMIEVKRAAGKALLGQDGIFSGLRRSEETGTTEQHLIEMLTAGGFYNDDRWGHRAGEPNKAVICSLALARLRTDIRGSDLANSNAVGMAQKLLLFWRKPARRCWWEGVELDGVEGVEGKLKVWIRRVWTLEM
ncbi:hypothetical protein MMC07_000071, partial [Pseudocyphellaria aurata]|nr:hypothetical protein [Pseudocyphellaria aurata]